MRLLFSFLVILCLYNLSSNFVTLGDKNALLKFEMFLDLTQGESGVLMSNFFKALEETCLKEILYSGVQLKIYLVTNSMDSSYKELISYINFLEEISLPFEECKNCNLKKYIKISTYIKQVTQNLQKLSEGPLTEKLSELMAVVIDPDSFKYLRSNKELETVYNSDMNIFRSIGLSTPLVYINSVNINSAKEYTHTKWKEVFKDNSNKGDCENWQEFLSRLKYY